MHPMVCWQHPQRSSEEAEGGPAIGAVSMRAQRLELLGLGGQEVMQEGPQEIVVGLVAALAAQHWDI